MYYRLVMHGNSNIKFGLNGIAKFSRWSKTQKLLFNSQRR